MKVVKCDTFKGEYVVMAEYMTARFTEVYIDPDFRYVKLLYNGENTKAHIHLKGVDDFLEQFGKLKEGDKNA